MIDSAKAPVIAAAVTAGDIAVKMAAPDLLSGLLRSAVLEVLPFVAPFFWGAVGAIAVSIWVATDAPMSTGLRIASAVVSALVASGMAVSLGQLIGVSSGSFISLAAIVVGVGAPVIIRTIHANIASWVKAIGDRFAAGPKAQQDRPGYPPYDRPERPPEDRKPGGPHG